MRTHLKTTEPTVLEVLPALETGGVEHVVAELTEALAKEGFSAFVASAGGRMVERIVATGGKHIVLPLDARNPLALWRNAERLARLIREKGVALVHVHSRAPAYSARLAAKWAGARFVTSYHSPYNEGFPGKRAYNSVMASGERVVAVSRFLAELIAARHGTDPARIRVIPNGVDPVRFDPLAIDPTRRAELAKAWRLPPGAPVIMLPARLTRWKGQPVLIAALSRLARKDAVAVLVGSSQGRAAYVDELQRQAVQLGVAERLRIVGEVADMPTALSLADVVVSASTEPEGFGRAVIEAQAMERVMVAAAHGAVLETVRDRETGFLVPPGNVEELAAALAFVLDLSAAERAAIGANARRHVVAEYSVAAMQARHIALYRELLT
ncbi:MAG: glycosyltransferase family 4 protein [Acidobacteriia bacterium]|nr:glycosyltransferase family 4 protein [Methyloceanibacter sp.]MCL6492548.1 glycosyltransferase family 4 protein [Terriglobia bacterium]